MKIAGIVCEYNPFHNGHRYQIEETRKSGATHIVAVMSGNFVQRGEPSFIDKHIRAQMAVLGGADLVIELPVPYSVAPAELFARGAVHILSSLGVIDCISFGSECGDTVLLGKAADAAQKITDSEELRQLLSEGKSYPSAFHSIIESSCKKEVADVFRYPNNTLAVEYIKALRYLKSNIEPLTVTRKSVSHDSREISGSFASASLLRNEILSGNDVSEYVPSECGEIINRNIAQGNIASFSRLSEIVRYRMLSATEEEWKKTPDASNGLRERLVKSALKYSSIDEILADAKTKCFTMARLRRCICNLLLGVTVEDFCVLPPYARVLAFNQKGVEVMSLMKDKSAIPFSASLAKLSAAGKDCLRYSYLDSLASSLLSASVSNKQFLKNEYSIKVKILNNL